jgi:DNA-binding transcriptional LysR family regulator
VDLDVRHLRLIVAAADTGSLSGAARVLGIRQPTVTTQLQRIEEVLGGPLFERSPQGVVVTERGRAVLRRARAILSRMERIIGPAPTRPAPAAVRVRTFILPFEVLLPLLAHLVPGVRWEVDSGRADEGLSAVAAGDADLFLGIRWDEDPPPPDGLVTAEVLRERGWLMLPSEHRLAAEPLVDLTDVAGETWVSRPEPELHRALLRDCRRAGFEPDVQFRAVDTMAQMTVVASGAAVALTSPVVDIVDGVAVRPVAGTQAYTWLLAHRPGSLPVQVMDLLRDLFRWAYVTKAGDNAELLATLPTELRLAQLPEPLTGVEVEGAAGEA